MTGTHTQHSLLDNLRNLGVMQGDGVWVHASLRSMGQVEGGAATVIEALQAAVGHEGLVGMPGFTRVAYPPPDMDRNTLSQEEIDRIEHAVTGYDITSSPTQDMGVLAETFRTWPATIRSMHPTTSVCLNGPDAEALTWPHGAAWATGSDSPFGRMMDRAGMKILLIGVDWTRCTPLHTAESFAEYQRHKVRRYKSGPGDAPWLEVPDVADDVGRLFPGAGAAFEATGQVTCGLFGGADTRLCGYGALVRFAAQWISDENERSGAKH